MVINRSKLNFYRLFTKFFLNYKKVDRRAGGKQPRGGSFPVEHPGIGGPVSRQKPEQLPL